MRPQTFYPSAVSVLYNRDVHLTLIDWLTILFQLGNTFKYNYYFRWPSHIHIIHASFIRSSIYICTYVELKTYKIYKIPLKLCCVNVKLVYCFLKSERDGAILNGWWKIIPQFMPRYCEDFMVICCSGFGRS